MTPHAWIQRAIAEDIEIHPEKEETIARWWRFFEWFALSRHQERTWRRLAEASRLRRYREAMTGACAGLAALTESARRLGEAFETTGAAFAVFSEAMGGEAGWKELNEYERRRRPLRLAVYAVLLAVAALAAIALASAAWRWWA